MKAVSLSTYNNNLLRALLSLKITEKKIPKPGKDEVVVKMHAASCNPSDIAFIQGGYNIVKTLPAVPGFEGSGTVVETGSNTVSLLGKKVSCFVQEDNDGTWAEYFKLNKNDLIVLREEMNMEQAACFSVNPFTAFALVKLAELNKSNTIIQNAAGGQVPSLVRQVAQIKGIKTIDIVRKKETADKLVAEDVENVLFEQEEQFAEKLHILANDLKATIAFDAVGGSSTGVIFNALPNHSKHIVYGGLSNKTISEVNTMDIIFKDKTISGFNLLDWKDEIGQEKFGFISDKLQNLFIENKLKTVIRGEVKLDNIIRGLKTYLGNMSKGKILIKP
jgi:NADPH:quinone reductase